MKHQHGGLVRDRRAGASDFLLPIPGFATLGLILVLYAPLSSKLLETFSIGGKVLPGGSMRKLLIVAAVLISILTVLAVATNWCQPGRFSRCNFERIKEGMKLQAVELLLGCPGVEVSEAQLLGIVDHGFPVDSPKRLKTVIAGEKFFRWEDSARYILISLKAGVVHEKCYWEPSF